MTESIDNSNLPENTTGYVNAIVRKMRYRQKVRQEVEAELLAHFEDALRDCVDEQETQTLAEQLIAEFGDVGILARLIRRGKKRCRPWWRTACVRILQATCLFIAAVIAYIAWFLAGQPRPSINYLAQLNELGRPEIVDADNAWPLYEKAIEHFQPSGNGRRDDEDENVVPDDALTRVVRDLTHHKVTVTALGPDDRQTLADWIKKNETTWQYIRQGTEKTYCYRQYTAEPMEADRPPLILGTLLPHVPPLVDITRLGVCRIQWLADEGDIDQAAESCLTLARLGRHLQDRVILIEYIVGTGTATKAMNECIALAASQDWDEAQLSALQTQCRNVWADGYPEAPYRFERMMFHDTVQQVFTKGGPGGGHLVPRVFTSLADIGVDEGEAALTFIHAGRTRTLEEAEKLYDHIERTATMTPFERRSSKVDDMDEMLTSLPRYRFAMLRMMIPAFGRVSEIQFRGMCTLEATQTILALRRYRLEHASYPQTLDALVQEGLLAALPPDPYSDQPLRYQLRGEDFLLYSIGGNFTNDNGQVHPKHEWGDGEEAGDRVFWPPRRP